MFVQDHLYLYYLLLVMLILAIVGGKANNDEVEVSMLNAVAFYKLFSVQVSVHNLSVPFRLLILFAYVVTAIISQLSGVQVSLSTTLLGRNVLSNFSVKMLRLVGLKQCVIILSFLWACRPSMFCLVLICCALTVLFKDTNLLHPETPQSKQIID